LTRSVGLLLMLLTSVINRLPAQNLKQNVAADIAQTRRALEAPLKYSGTLYRSGNHRDPFLNPLLLKKELRTDEEIARGLPPPGMAGTYISQATLQGIALRDNDRVAVVRGADRRTYFIREGDRLFDGYVRAIESDSITLVRETRMRSGKTFTQDVVKRLRTP
jgi:Tfp pilus assembly protein PilP